MANNPQNARIGKTSPVISQVTVAPIRFISQDIGNWTHAIDAARNRDNPRRRLLLELYANIMLDGMVSTVATKRIAGVVNKRFVFYDRKKKGDIVDSIQQNVIDTIWFSDLKRQLGEKPFYGHSVFEIVPGQKGIERIDLIPRTNIMPERGELLISYMDQTGIPYKGENADENLRKYLIEYGKPKDYGLLMVLAQYVIYKRGGFGDWGQFAEIFGMPFRVGTYDPYDNVTREKLLTALSEMGGAGYAAIPMGTDIKFETGNFGSGQSGIFKDLIDTCNDEIAKVVLGGTMTTKNGSSHSQSETHKDGEKEITMMDLQEHLGWLNGPFRERLIEFGYADAANGYFDVDSNEVISLQDRIIIDQTLATIVEIDPEYFYEHYGVPMPATGPKLLPPPAAPVPPTEDPSKPGGQKKKDKLMVGPQNLAARLTAYYQDHTCAHCADLSSAHIELKATSDKDIERLAKALFDKKIKAGQVDKKLLKATAKQLWEGLYEGFGKDPDFVKTYPETMELMRENIFIFSGFKTEKQLRDASALLVDDKGNMRPFADFLEKVKEIDATYNVAHLAAEYNHAVASGQMFTKWQTFQDLKEDFPNLIYTTAGDDRVRPSHVVLDGSVRPINDVFWNTNYPPNGWNCRCDVDATDAAVNDIGGKGGDHGKMFMHNVGKDGIVFPESHPYFEASEATRKRVIAAAKSAMKP